MCNFALKFIIKAANMAGESAQSPASLSDVTIVRLQEEVAALKAELAQQTHNSKSMPLICNNCKSKFTYGVCHNCYCDALPGD